MRDTIWAQNRPAAEQYCSSSDKFGSAMRPRRRREDDVRFVKNRKLRPARVTSGSPHTTDIAHRHIQKVQTGDKEPQPVMLLGSSGNEPAGEALS